MKKILNTIIPFLFIANFAYADLKGVSEMHLLIEGLSDQAASCGVKEDKIETSIKYILSNSKIKLVKSTSSIPKLYIRATIGNNSGTCYSHTSIEVYQYIKHPYVENYGDFLFYNDGAIASGGKTAFAPFFFDQLEDKLKKLVVRHNEFNK